MSFLNAPVPNFKCYVRERFFYDGEPKARRRVRAVAFGVVSRPGHALGVHVLTERGVQWYGLPLHALSWKVDAPERDLRDLESWDCFSFHLSVTEFPLLSGLRCSTWKGDKGACLFTIDWTHAGDEIDPSWSRIPDEHKQGHFLKLDDGNFGLQPNNRLLWEELSLVTKPFTFVGTDRPDFARTTETWSVER